MATIIPITIAGMSNNPIPRGINARITTKPITAPIIVNRILNSTTPTFNAATINMKNINMPNIISIYYLLHKINIYPN